MDTKDIDMYARETQDKMEETNRNGERTYKEMFEEIVNYLHYNRNELMTKLVSDLQIADDVNENIVKTLNKLITFEEISRNIKKIMDNEK